ncbi:MAG: DUF4403 family protein [Flavihumibacter sp.]
MFRQFLKIIVPLLFLTACGGSKKASQPVAPVPVKSLPALSVSTVYIPVKVAIKPFLEIAEKMAPREITSTGWPAYMVSSCDFRYKYRFLRAVFRFACVNNEVQVTMNGEYQIAGSQSVCVLNQPVSPWVNGSCGFAPESMRRVNINLTSRLRFLPDYRLQTTTAVSNVTAVDKCTVTVFKNDVTQQVIDSIAASVNFYGSNIDAIVNNMRFDNYLQPLAEKAGKKIPLSTYGYMKLNANAVNIGPINFSSDTLRFTAAISCYPEISSDSNNYSVTSNLPPLGSATSGNGFSITANAIYDYTTIDTLLTRTLRNRSFDIKGEKIRISKVEVRGLDNYRVAFKVMFTGTKRGTLLLTGTPELDLYQQTISVPDLEFDLNSSSLVLQIGKTFFSQRILDNLRQQATIDVSDIYYKNKAKIDAQLNRHISTGIDLKGNTDRLRLNGLVINKDNVQVQASVAGAISLLISQVPGF